MTNFAYFASNEVSYKKYPITYKNIFELENFISVTTDSFENLKKMIYFNKALGWLLKTYVLLQLLTAIRSITPVFVMKRNKDHGTYP